MKRDVSVFSRVGSTVAIVLGLSVAFAAVAADVPEVVVEAGAPVHVAKAGQSTTGGAQVDMLSVKYHVHASGLDLTKTADVAKLDEQIKMAAQKGCDTIKAQYPARSMTDDQSCVAAAIKSADVQRKALIAAAGK